MSNNDNKTQVNNTPKRQPTQFDGRKALIIGDHPHSGAVAECQGLGVTLIGPGLVFKNDITGVEFFVFHPKHVSWNRK